MQPNPNEQPVELYDVVQVLPGHNWEACCLTVTELHPWGVQGYVVVPEKGRAFIRLKTGEFARIGPSAVLFKGDEDQP